MRRTLQTAQQGLGWLMRRGVPVILRAEWQENSAKPCDTGTDISVMEKEWPQFDWSTVDPTFPDKTGLYEHSKRGLTERGIAARTWLRNRPEKIIAVVSHSGFLRVGVSHCMVWTTAISLDLQRIKCSRRVTFNHLSSCSLDQLFSIEQCTDTLLNSTKTLTSESSILPRVIMKLVES
jgi:broad specificity phosphatase PhoE